MTLQILIFWTNLTHDPSEIAQAEKEAFSRVKNPTLYATKAVFNSRSTSTVK